MWLNEYSEIPKELLQYKNLDIRLGDPKYNIKDAGKFAFLDAYYDCYYMTIDDDIEYAPDYVAKMTMNIDRYGRKCIVAYHGHGKYPKYNRYHYKYVAFYDTLDQDHLVNVRTGTGVTGFVPSEIKIPILSVERLFKIDTDVSLGVWANNNNVSMICCAHKKGWLKNIQIDGIKYDQISKLTGTKYLNEKRASEIKKLKTIRQVFDPIIEAKTLNRCLAI